MWLLLFVLWMILNGRITLELVLFGIAIATAVTLFAYRVIGYPPSTDLRVWRNLPLLILYLLDLIAEILRSAFVIMKMVFSAREPDPVLVEFRSGLPSKMQNVLLANSITLTPGTITVFQEGDRFVVHAVRRELADGIEDCTFVKLLSRMR